MGQYHLTNEDLDIDEKRYKPDFEILGKYQAFSSELLRISLIAIGSIGFLYEKLKGTIDVEKILFGTLAVKSLMFISLIFLVFSSAFALAHRYFSSDSMACLIYGLRCTNAVVLEQKNEVRRSEFETKAEAERNKRKRLFSDCRNYLLASAICLVSGVLFLVLGFILGQA